MAILSTNMPAAEVFIGGTFAETFVDEYAVGLNGGTLFNNPTVSDGLILDGVDQYAQYTLDANVLNSDPLSFVVEFIPNFDWDEDTNLTFFDSDSTGTNRYLIFKRYNAASNSLFIQLNSITIAEVPSATYSPYWLVNQRNVLVVSSESGDTNAYLNGTQILTSDVTAWTPSNELDFFIGSDYTLANNFKGTITSLKIYHAKLSAQEALDFYNDDTYDYDDHLVMDLPCTSCFGDTGNTRTRDASDNDNDGTFGDGVTPSTYPTKLEYRGYSFDGVAQYLDCGDAGSTLTNDFSLCIQLKTTDDNVRLISRRTTSTHFDFYINSGTGSMGFYEGSASRTSITPINDDVIHNGIVAIDNNIVSFYTDGLLDSVPSLAVSITTFDTVTNIGAFSNGSTGFLEGDILQVAIYSIPLTSIQSADWHLVAEAAEGNF